MSGSASPCIAIDCRMLGMSGIGVYIENLVPDVVRRLSGCRFRLIGQPDMLRRLALPDAARVTMQPCHAPVYSVQEQLLMPLAARGAALLWVPHYAIPLLTRVPLLVTVHDVAHLVLPEVTQNRIRRAYARFFFEHVRRRARTILTVSQFTADEFLRHVGKPRGALRVVHNGVDAEWFAPPRTRLEDAPQAATPYFIAVGNLKAHKGIDLLCRAFAAVKDTLPHNLLLVGKYDGFITGGQSVEELLALAPGRIHCTGPIDAPRLRALVRGAAALVFPSRYEGFGLPPLEAMAAGTPVIAADIPPVREVCGEHITYFAVDDAPGLQARLLECVREDGAARAQQLTQAQAHAATFTWQAAGARVAGEMTACLPTPPAGS